ELIGLTQEAVDVAAPAPEGRVEIRGQPGVGVVARLRLELEIVDDEQGVTEHLVGAREASGPLVRGLDVEAVGQAVSKLIAGAEAVRVAVPFAEQAARQGLFGARELNVLLDEGDVLEAIVEEIDFVFDPVHPGEQIPLRRQWIARTRVELAPLVAGAGDEGRSYGNPQAVLEMGAPLEGEPPERRVLPAELVARAIFDLAGPAAFAHTLTEPV